MTGAPASPSGSRASTEPVPVSAASGFDPSRIESLIAECETLSSPSQWLDAQIMWARFPEWAKPEAPFLAPHCVGDEPIYFHAPNEFRKRPVPRVTLTLGDTVKLLDPRALWAVGCMEDGPFARLCWPMPDGGYSGGYVEAYAASVPRALCAAVLKAIATEARRVETQNSGSIHEGADPKGIAQ